tara:strand:- start:335 stop:721 length:387 start_codon:yes stop_codon:yes gene_type:complete
MDFDKGIKRVLRSTSRWAGKRSMAFFLDSYSKQGTTKKTFSKWKARKDKKNKRPILVDTRLMKKSFKLSTMNNNFKIENTTDYAIYHNEGSGINLPKREILYNSEKLNKIIEDEMTREVIKMMEKMFK